MTQCHNLENHDMNIHRRENLARNRHRVKRTYGKPIRGQPIGSKNLITCSACVYVYATAIPNRK
jgi:hypothetical protein